VSVGALKKRVIQVITSPSGGGAEVLVRELGSLLGADNIISEVIYFKKPDDVRALELSGDEFFLHNSLRSPSAIFKLRKIFRERLRRGERLIVHAHLTWPFYYVALASLFLSLDIVYTEHNTSNRRRGFRVLRVLDRFFYSRYRKVICISEGVKTSLVRWLGKDDNGRLVTIGNGSRMYEYCDRKVVRGLRKKPELVSVGSLTKQKGFSTAIAAIALLRDEIGCYVIVGEGPERSHLMALVHKNKLEGKVVLAGWRSDVEDFYRNADIQLIPSHWEGFGLVAVEGMSTGLPVIASDVEGLRDVVSSENPSVELVTDFKNPRSWSAALKNVIQRFSASPDDISMAARRQAEKFSMERMVDRYRQMYNSL